MKPRPHRDWLFAIALAALLAVTLVGMLLDPSCRPHSSNPPRLSGEGT